MGLIEQAIRDIKDITTNQNDFGVEISLVSKKHSTTATVVGLTNKIHMALDTEGNMVSSKTATVAISELALSEANYPHRNANGEFDMIGDRVTFKDSSGALNNFVVKSKIPDESSGIGLAVLILSDYK